MLRIGLLALAAGRAAGFGVAGPRVARGMARAAAPQMNFYDFSATTIDGKAAKMSDYKGKPVLILNVASL